MQTIITTRTKYIRFAESILNNLQDAEDVVQDCYIRVLEKEAVERPEAYMMRAVRNACLDLLRRKRPEALEEELMDRKADSVDIGQLLEQKEQIKRLQLLMQYLSEKQRTVFFLRDIEGYKLQHIELMTGMNNDAIRANLSRARKQLREWYNKII